MSNEKKYAIGCFIIIALWIVISLIIRLIQYLGNMIIRIILDFLSEYGWIVLVVLVSIIIIAVIIYAAKDKKRIQDIEKKMFIENEINKKIEEDRIKEIEITIQREDAFKEKGMQP